MAPVEQGTGSSTAPPRALQKMPPSWGRNLGQQVSLQQYLGMEQMLCARVGILQENKEEVQWLCRVQRDPLPHLACSQV